MEPWHFSHGEARRASGRTSATSGLQWSHGILAMESCLACRPATTLATASMEPWHFSHGEMLHAERLSMEPMLLQWSHGILAMESINASTVVGTWQPGFNGAMAF